MPSMLATLCPCCFGDNLADDHDQSRLLRDDDSYSQTSGYGSHPTENIDSAAGGGGGVGAANKAAQLSAAEEEQAILHRILMHTQAAVIDVSNMDNMFHSTATHNEFTQRMQRYDAALKRADPAKFKAYINRVAPASSSSLTNSTSSIVTQQPSTMYGSMDDVGPQVADVLAAPPISQAMLEFASERQARLREALLQTMRIEHQEDLVVHMGSN